MTGKERFIAHEKKMTGLLLKNLYGKTFEDVEREAMERASEAQKKADEAQKNAAEAQKKVTDLLRKSVFNLHEKLGLNPEQIAATLEVDLEIVRTILQNPND